jgi:hypothetical protein
MGFPLKIILPRSFQKTSLIFGNVTCAPTFKTDVIIIIILWLSEAFPINLMKTLYVLWKQ